MFKTSPQHSKKTQKTGPSKKATTSCQNELLEIKNVTMTKSGNRFTAIYSIDGKKLLCKQTPKELQEDLENCNSSSKQMLNDFLTSKNMTSINNKTWFKKKKKGTKKNEKCDAQHNDHNNYTKIIENPKDCGKDTMRFGMSCFFCTSEFCDENPDTKANIVVPEKNKHMCYSCQNFKEPFWCMHGICAQCKQLKIKEDIQNTTQSSRVTRNRNSL